jgi:hypothetical protein
MLEKDAVKAYYISNLNFYILLLRNFGLMEILMLFLRFMKS